MLIKSGQKYYSGTSGLVIKIPKYAFPDEFRTSSRLQFYASIFNSIEINSSFYKVPMAATVNKWSETTPPGFKFTFKLWKGITHNRNLDFNEADVAVFIQTIDHVGEKKGCLLIQFPPSINISTIHQLEKLLHCVRLADPSAKWPVAVEFRNNSWYQQAAYDLLNLHHASLVIHDHPVALTPLNNVTADVMYLRFHGVNGDYKGGYNDDFLQDQAIKIQQWLNLGKKVYVYFNNTIGDAIDNAISLHKLVENFGQV